MAKKNWGEIVRNNIVTIMFIVLCAVCMAFSGYTPAYVMYELFGRLSRNLFIVLALIIPIVAGMGINFAITIGAMAAQIACILVLEWGVQGFGGFALAAALTVPMASLFGFGIGKILNKMKGQEMIGGMILGYFANGLYQLLCLFIFDNIIPINNPNLTIKGSKGIANTMDLAKGGIAGALENGAVNVLGVVVEPILEILLSLGLGAIMGVLLDWVEHLFHSRSKRMTLSVAFVLLTVGLSQLKFTIGDVHCGFSLLLVCMMTGTVFCNVCDTSQELMDRVESWTVPLTVLFFVISGAELDLQVLVNPMTLLVGVVYIIARSAGKYFGARVSCGLSKCTPAVTNYLGITLLPQAGVALGMALTAMSLQGGALIRNVVLFSVLVYELVGPALTKWSLLKAGEIKPEGKTNARVVDTPRTPVSIHK